MRPIPLNAAILSLAALVAACGATPPPPAPVSELPIDPAAPTELVKNSTGTNDRLKAVARLEGAQRACSAVFVATGGRPSAPGYALASGHCVSDIVRPNDVFHELALEGVEAVFAYFVDTTDGHVRVPVARVAYSTMKGTDLSVLPLGRSIGERKGAGLEPLPLADAAPDVAARIEVVGVPDSGVPEGERFLRRASCRNGPRANVVEWIWHWWDLHSNDCGYVRGGSSGSAVLDASGRVFAVLNTTSQGATSDGCYQGQPCETDGAVRMRANTNYAPSVVGLRACFGGDGRFDAALAGCPLDPGSAMRVTQAVPAPTRPLRDDGTAVTWDVALEQPPERLRMKVGRASGIDCRSDDGYGAPFTADASPLATLALPAEHGLHLLCLQEGDAQGWQDPARATVIVGNVDTRAPTREPLVNVMPDVDVVRVEPIFDLPEYAHFKHKWGAFEATDCGDMSTAQVYRRFPVMLRRDALPVRYCVVGADSAGNWGAVFEKRIEGGAE